MGTPVQHRPHARPRHRFDDLPMFLVGWTLAIIGACLVATAFVWVAMAVLASFAQYVPSSVR